MDKLKLLQKIFGDDVEGLENFIPFVDEALLTLDEREQCVLQKRFTGMTLAATGKIIVNLGGKVSPCSGISRDRVRQIEAKALRKLRHPTRTRILKNEQQLINELSHANSYLIEHTITNYITQEKLEELKQLDVFELPLSTRTMHCLKNTNILSIGSLIMRSETELLRIKNFGRKSLMDVKNELGGIGLTLGTCVKYQND